MLSIFVSLLYFTNPNENALSFSLELISNKLIGMFSPVDIIWVSGPLDLYLFCNDILFNEGFFLPVFELWFEYFELDKL